MKTIASVAIEALNDLKKTIQDPNWMKGDYGHLFQAWSTLRLCNDYCRLKPTEWQGQVIELIDDAVACYKNPKFQFNHRSFFNETMNIRLTVNVMGGYHDCPKWKTESAILISP
jgi:hypothetical protein